MATDWRLKLEALALPGAKITCEAEPSVTHAFSGDRHVLEITRCHEIAWGLGYPIRHALVHPIDEHAQVMELRDRLTGGISEKVAQQPTTAGWRRIGGRRICPGGKTADTVEAESAPEIEFEGWSAN